jgi:uncharacterized protein
MNRWIKRISYRLRLWASTLLDPVPADLPRERASLFSTHADVGPNRLPAPDLAWPVPRPIPGSALVGMDANNVQDSVKPGYGNAYGTIPEVQLNWYGAQGFIGYQMMSLLAQHWLIEKACAMPAKDAMRKGYSLSLNDGTKLPPDVLDFIKEVDKIMRIKQQCIEFIRKGRIFGIRIAKFVVESDDEDYYKKPFNLDGVKPGAYKGIAQVDPYWIVPELTTEETLRPGSIHFYEPTFWRINGESIHRSHLCIYTTGQVPDVLKPSYYYGGVSITQRIYERVYAAERSANEAPMLLMTKRLTVLNTDIEQALADQEKFDKRMAWWSETRDNFGVKINATEDTITQHDTTLTGVDVVTLTQYQLVAAIAEVPGTKLLGTQPKGFNSTGEFEEASYHEMLESLQSNDIEPLLNKHHALVQQSYVVPKFGGKVLNIIVSWAELDAMTAQEQAAVNLTRLQGDAVGISIGALGADDARKRLVNDPDSGYAGISETLPPMPDLAGGGGDPNDPDNPDNGPIAPKPRIQAANIGPKGA